MVPITIKPSRTVYHEKSQTRQNLNINLLHLFDCGGGGGVVCVCGGGYQYLLYIAMSQSILFIHCNINIDSRGTLLYEVVSLHCRWRAGQADIHMVTKNPAIVF